MSEQAHTAAPASRGWSSFSRAVITLGAIGLVFTLLSRVASIVAPAFLALNLVIVVYPVFRWLVRHRVPRTAASVVLLVLVLGIMGLFVWGVGYSVAAMINQLTSYSAQFTSMYHRLIEWLSSLGVGQDVLLARLKGVDPSSVLNAASSLLSSAQGGLSMLTTLVLALLFIAMDAGGAHGRLDIVRRNHPDFVAGIYSFAEGVRKYWVVSTVFGLIVAVLDWGALSLLGVPLALVWAVLSFLTNYIPNIGFVIGLVPPALIALFEKGWQTAVIVVAAYSVLNFVVQSVIQPKFTGESVGITATLSFISLFVWTIVFGALGALIALPVSLFIKAMLVDADPALRWIDPLISSSPGESELAPDVDVEGVNAPDPDPEAAAKPKAAEVTDGEVPASEGR